MTNRISLDELSGMFSRYCDAVARAGYDVTNYRLQLGDEANSYRAMDNGSGTLGTGSYGYLGDTRREAYRALLLMAQTLEDIRYNTNKLEKSA
jgi:hypothetical protein